jgi:hypothetical protein
LETEITREGKNSETFDPTDTAGFPFSSPFRSTEKSRANDCLYFGTGRSAE